MKQPMQQMVTITISFKGQILNRCALPQQPCKLHASHNMSNFLASYSSLFIPCSFEIGQARIIYNSRCFNPMIPWVIENDVPKWQAQYYLWTQLCSWEHQSRCDNLQGVVNRILPTRVCIITYTLLRTLMYYHNSFALSLGVSM